MFGLRPIAFGFGFLAAASLALPQTSQTPASQPPASQPLTAQPTPAAEEAAEPPPPAPPATGPAARPAAQISLNFKDAPIDAVLEHLSTVAGFVIVKETPVSGRVTVLSVQPITPAESVTLLNTVLKVNGYTAVQMGRILKIVSRDKAKKENIPVHFGADAEAIQNSDDLITQVIPVHSVDAEKLKQDLQPLVNPDADFSANAASNTLIMTDTSANIRRVVEIVSSLDKRDALENSIHVRQLQYADATATAKLITDIFSPPTQSQGANDFNPLSFFRSLRGGGGGGGGRDFGGFGGFGGRDSGGRGGSSTDNTQDQGHAGKVQASADTRTNTVVVSGPTETLKVIDDMLNQLDANPAAEQTFFIYHVTNGQAVDMANTLNGLFGGNGSTGGNTQQATNTRSGYNTTTGNRVSGIGGNTGGGLGGGGLGGGGGGLGGGGGGTSGVGSNSNNRNTSNFSQARNPLASMTTGGANSGLGSTTDLIGQVYVVPDQDTNSLLVATRSKFEQRVKDVILELDRPVPQVLIKVLIAEVTHDNSLDFGQDFSVLNLRASGNGQKLTNTLGAAAAAASPVAPGGMVVNILESNLTATLQALAQENKLDVLSRPYILTSDNQEADITVGNEVPFITDTYVDTNGGTHNSFQYQDIGIILDVTPHINPEGLVIMQVAPQISSLTGQTVTISAGVNLPVFELRSATSYVAVKDGQTIVIGGLMQDQKTESISKIPILGDIPLLGKLFQYSTKDKSKTELLIFLTPHVAQQPDRLKPMAEEEIKGLKLTPTAVGPGIFQEHMQGLQVGGATTQPATQPAAGGAMPTTRKQP